MVISAPYDHLLQKLRIFHLLLPANPHKQGIAALCRILQTTRLSITGHRPSACGGYSLSATATEQKKPPIRGPESWMDAVDCTYRAMKMRWEEVGGSVLFPQIPSPARYRRESRRGGSIRRWKGPFCDGLLGDQRRCGLALPYPYNFTLLHRV